jgi:hypothetical protein
LTLGHLFCGDAPLFSCVGEVREQRDADGGEHGLQGEQHHICLGRDQLFVQQGDGHLRDGRRNLLGGDRRGQIEGGALVLGFDPGAVGGDSESPQERLCEGGLCDRLRHGLVFVDQREALAAGLRCGSTF